jgi:rubrerythrin
LAGGYENIQNMSGGIIAFNGGKAVGDESFGMEHFVTGDFAAAFQMSYAMDEGVRQLYLALEEQVADREAKMLLGRLAVFEEGHKEKLKAMFPEASAADAAAERLEGGFDRGEVLAYFQSQTGSLEDILQLGMMLETQALDLYTRLSRQTESDDTKELFEYLAKEETQHLTFISKEFDAVLAVR